MLAGVGQPTAAKMTVLLTFLTGVTTRPVHIDQPCRSRSMDDLDKRLIFALRADGRAPVASLAKSLGVARGTVQNRMARLESEGIIVGYTVKLRPQIEEEHRIRGLMMIEVEGNQASSVQKALLGDPAITQLHTTNGRWDLVAELRADSLQEFDRVLARVRLLAGIANTETNLLLSTHKL
jgi:DNA-binding Lrp family transcriptional regulator